MTNTEKINLLCVLLDCGVDDLCVLDEAGYDICHAVRDMRAEGTPVTLNGILEEIFSHGQQELCVAVQNAIADRDAQLKAAISDEEFTQASREIDELESLSLDYDMTWDCNYGSTECWLANRDVYEKYIPEALDTIEDGIGFPLQG